MEKKLYFSGNSSILNFLAIFSLALGMAYLSSLRVGINTQIYISAVFLGAMLLLIRVKTLGFFRVLFLTISSYLVLRYFFWRTFYSLEYQDFFSSIGMIILYLAEIYGGIMFFLSVFINIRPLKRQVIALPEDRHLWPTVDILIPSYNEPPDLVMITLAAAGNIDYPKEKINIYLLDDGATEQKLNSTDEQIRIDAIERRIQFKKICAELNVHYLNRKENSHAKAGNLNSALAHINSELILVLDADHAPTVDILIKTIGAFIQDEKIFLVQTPHFFINADPVEKNLDLFHRIPSENLMFYGAIQPGLDFWQSSFFCGSAAVLRRKAIDETGGFHGKTITEDSETALILHSKGWKSHYVMLPLISGLQPETFSSFLIQRIRWAQGMVQNFIFYNPLLMPRLKIWQRICYLSNMLFWFFPFARVVFLLAPGFYLFFGLKIYNANASEIFCYTVPYLFALILTNHFLFSKFRWIFLSEIYETLQSLFSIRAVWAVLKHPEHPRFSVTPKMEKLEKDFISPLAAPFYWIVLLVILQICFGFWRFFMFSSEQSMVAITMFWTFFNLLLILAVLGALYEHRQRRVNPRISVNIQANWLIKSNIDNNEIRIPITITDLSVSGCKFFSEKNIQRINLKQNSYLEVPTNQPKSYEYFKGEIVNSITRDNGYVYGVNMQNSSTDEFSRMVRFVYGDSLRWAKATQDSEINPGLIKSMLLITKIGITHGISHIKIAFQTL